MSQEDIKILQAFSEAFNRRDFDDATQYMDPPSKSIPASWLQTTTRNCALHYLFEAIPVRGGW